MSAVSDRPQPPKPTPRLMVNVRLSPNGLKAVDDLAEVEDVTRSEMIRRLLSEAVAARGKR